MSINNFITKSNISKENKKLLLFIIKALNNKESVDPDNDSTFWINSPEDLYKYYNKKEENLSQNIDYDDQKEDPLISQLNYDPKQVAYDRYLETGDDAYLYGDSFPEDSREYRVWASIHKPSKFQGHENSEDYTPKITNSINISTTVQTTTKSPTTQRPQKPQPPVAGNKPPTTSSIISHKLYKILKAMQDPTNQNNAGYNQYNNKPNTVNTEASNALNTTAPVNGTYSTSNMEQQQPQGSPINYNPQTQNANPTGQNGQNTTSNSSSLETNTSTPDMSKFKNELQNTPLSNFNMNEGVISNIKKQLEEIGKEYTRKETQGVAADGKTTNIVNEKTKNPLNMDEVKRELEKLPKELFKSLEVAPDGYIEEDPNKLPLSAEKEKEVEQFFQPDKMTEIMDETDKKSVKIKMLLKSLNSLSENEGIFKDIKNAKKYAKMYNTKLAEHNEKAYVIKPTLKDIRMFGQKISKVEIKKY